MTGKNCERESSTGSEEKENKFEDRKKDGRVIKMIDSPSF